MTIQNKTTLKGYFNIGDVPTEQNFIDLIDSFFYIGGEILAGGEIPLLKIRHGGQTGEGFSHPTNAESAIYVTGRHTSPPANSGGVDLANFYLQYTGDLSSMTGTLENVEIVTALSGVTVAPTQAVVGFEVNISTPGSNAGIVFPDVRGIYGDVGLSVNNAGTITWARSISAVLPSGSSATGNAITNAACLYAFGTGGAAGSVLNPTNAYGLYVEAPTIGTNKWAIYAAGKVEILGGNLLCRGDIKNVGTEAASSGKYYFTTSTADKWYINYSTDHLGFVLAGIAETLIVADTGSILIGTVTDGMTQWGSLAIAKDLAHRGTLAGFYNHAPAARPAKASHNNWAALSDVVAALVEIGLLDAA